MVSSCTHDNVTVKHDPIDFGGQVQKTTATLSGDTGSYDVLETYSFVVPDLASRGKLVPLDDLFAKYTGTYKLEAIDEYLPLLQQASAATVLLTLPVVGIAFVAQKYLVTGLASGAVKG